MLYAAESAARQGEIRCQCRRRWKTVLPDDNLIAHEHRRGRCRPASSAAATAAATAAAAVAVAAAATAASNKAANAPDNVLLVVTRYSPR